MLALNIDNPEIENIFMEKFKSNKNDFINFIAHSLRNIKSEESGLDYTRKDPFKNIKKLEYTDVDEELTNPFKNIEDTLFYSKELREKSWK